MWQDNRLVKDHSVVRHVSRLQLDAWLLPMSRSILILLVATNAVLFTFALGDGQSLQEPASSAYTAGRELEVILNVADEDASTVRECRIWGPAQSVDEFAELMPWLEEQGGFPEIQEALVAGAPDYLTYITNLSSREHAKRTSQELKNVDIDSYVINRRDVGLILSVGAFSKPALAQAHFERLQGLGYEVILQKREHRQTVFNLEAHVPVESSDYGTSVSACTTIAQNK